VLEVVTKARREIALVDVCVSLSRHIGARALWDPSSLTELYCTFAEPDGIGLSSVPGLVRPVGVKARACSGPACASSWPRRDVEVAVRRPPKPRSRTRSPWPAEAERSDVDGAPQSVRTTASPAAAIRREFTRTGEAFGLTGMRERLALAVGTLTSASKSPAPRSRADDGGRCRWLRAPPLGYLLRVRLSGRNRG